MKIKIYAEESFVTTVKRMDMEIDTNDYPELEGMDEDQISNYIDDNIWDMKPTNDLYSSLGEQVSDQDMEFDDISNDRTEFLIEAIS